ncbi:hypothetical protein F5884DRAFT_866510 [Xylogone sp. PMI_703]|nr:hypothetical protein F5884DRAFT_866510 [Xylogone sp. PMI_703]
MDNLYWTDWQPDTDQTPNPNDVLDTAGYNGSICNTYPDMTNGLFSGEIFFPDFGPETVHNFIQYSSGSLEPSSQLQDASVYPVHLNEINTVIDQHNPCGFPNRERLDVLPSGNELNCMASQAIFGIPQLPDFSNAGIFSNAFQQFSASEDLMPNQFNHFDSQNGLWDMVNGGFPQEMQNAYPFNENDILAAPIYDHDLIPVFDLNPSVAVIQQENTSGILISSNSDESVENFSRIESGQSRIQDHILLHPYRIQKKRKASIRKKNRTPPTKWEYIRDWHLHRLFIEEAHTLDELVFEMSVIHDFTAGKTTYEKKFAQWPEFKKNMTQGSEHQVPSNEGSCKKADRRRPGQSLPDRKSNARGLRSIFVKKVVSQEEELPLVRAITYTVYIDQERMFHAIDGLVKGFFGAGSNSWTANNMTFDAPMAVANNSKVWRHLSSQCQSIATLVQAKLFDQVNFLLKKINVKLGRLETTANLSDPNILIYFWQICHILSNIRYHTRMRVERYAYLNGFLQRLKRIFSRLGNKHSLVVFLDSLYQVLVSKPDDFITTLRLGYWKTIHILGDVIGGAHAIVLRMGIHCTKNWRSKFGVHEEQLNSQYKNLPSLTENLGGTRSEIEKNISLWYDYIYGMSERKHNSEAIMNIAAQLRDVTSGICRKRATLKRLYYNTITQAFVFSTELLSVHYLDVRVDEKSTQDLDLSVQYMSEAVEILRQGDRECLIQAMSFSRRIALWFKTFKRPQEADSENRRGKEIVSKIEKEPVEILVIDRNTRGDANTKEGTSHNNRLRRKRMKLRDSFLCSLSANIA